METMWEKDVIVCESGENAKACQVEDTTGVNPAGDAGDTSHPIFWLGGVNGNIPTNIITYFWI